MAQATLQRVIDVEQDYDAVVYGLRSIKTCGGVHSCVGVHAAQLDRAVWAAAKVLGREANGIRYSQGGHGTADRLREAKQRLADELAEAKAELKALGGIRQRRLALAEAA